MNNTPETDEAYKNHPWDMHDYIPLEFCQKLERERDEAYSALIYLRKGYGGQLADYADDECKCTDCEVLRKIDAVLKKHEL